MTDFVAALVSLTTGVVLGLPIRITSITSTNHGWNSKQRSIPPIGLKVVTSKRQAARDWIGWLGRDWLCVFVSKIERHMDILVALKDEEKRSQQHLPAIQGVMRVLNGSGSTSGMVLTGLILGSLVGDQCRLGRGRRFRKGLKNAGQSTELASQSSVARQTLAVFLKTFQPHFLGALEEVALIAPWRSNVSGRTLYRLIRRFRVGDGCYVCRGQLA